MSLALLLYYFEDPAAMPHFLTYFNMISTILLKRLFVSSETHKGFKPL